MLIVVLAQCLALEGYGYVHVHPVPHVPSETDVFAAVDTFAINLMAQIHKTLFSMNNNQPVPELITSYSVSSDQLVYQFRLKALAFHNGLPLTHTDVGYSLDEVIRRRAPGFEKLAAIQGFHAFASGQSDGLSGFHGGPSKQEFSLQLREPDPNLLYHLTELRFSIVQHRSPPSIGLGDYRLLSLQPNRIELQKIANVSGAPERIVYVEASLPSAMDGLKQGIYHDLFAYAVGDDMLNQLKDRHVAIRHIHTPRTYLFFVSPRAIPDIDERERLLLMMDKRHLIQQCYAGNTPTTSLVPPGFLGHIHDNETTTTVALRLPAHATKKIRDIRIFVAKGISNESCVVRWAEQTIGSRPDINLHVREATVEETLAAWKSGDIDGMVAYLEADNSLDFFQFFNPAANVHFGVLADSAHINPLLQLYNSESDPLKRHGRAVALSHHVRSLRTVLPLFHPKQYLVFDNRYRELQIKVQSPALIQFIQLERRMAHEN